MGYPTRLLADDEKIAFEMKPHWRALIFPALVFIVLIAATAFLYAKIDGEGSGSTVLRIVVGLVALFILIVWAVRPFLLWFTTQYVFTDRRIVVRTGVIAKRGKDIPLARVNDVSFSYSIVGRMLNYGVLVIQSAAEQGAVVIADVPHVEEVQREVYRLHEADDQRRRGHGPGSND